MKPYGIIPLSKSLARAAFIFMALWLLSPSEVCLAASDEVYVTRNFKYGIKGLTAELDSFKTDCHNLYFSALNASGTRSWRKVQLSDGASDVSGEDFTAAERPGLKDCARAAIDSPKDRAALKNMLCDGKVLFAAPVDIGKKKYHAAIASDWHLYIFAYNDLFKGRSFPVYKTPIGAPPVAALYSGSHIFAVTDEFIACFGVAGDISERGTRVLAPSTAGVDISDAIRASVEISDGTINDFDCAVRYARSSDIVYRKLEPARHVITSPHEKFLFLSMGLGFGNSNIYSMNMDFSFARLTNFAGAIADFKVIDPAKPLFSIAHSPDPLVKSADALKEWTLAPPSALGPAAGAPMLKRAGRNETAGGAVYSSRPSPDGYYFKLSPSINGGEFIIEAVDANGKTADTSPVAFAAHGNLAASWPCPAAVSSNPRRTMAFFYDRTAGFFRVYDAGRGREHDSFRFDLGDASISAIRFSFDNEFVMFRVRYPVEAGGAAPADALFVYRVINKTLMKAAAHRVIGDFDCIKHENKHKIVLIYGDDGPYCSCVGFIAIE